MKKQQKLLKSSEVNLQIWYYNESHKNNTGLKLFKIIPDSVIVGN